MMEMIENLENPGEPEKPHGELSEDARARIAESRAIFEAAWRSGRRPRAEEHVGQAKGLERQRLLEELRQVELRWRARLGERPAPQESDEHSPEIAPRTGLRPEEAPAPAHPGRLAPDPDAPLPFSDFELVRRIGKGGMGTVYEAIQKSLRRPVAVKVLAPDFAATEVAAARFLAEARAVARLRHPNIVVVHGVGRTDGGGYFLVMDLIDGQDLESRITLGEVPVGEAAGIVAVVADAVQHAHDHRVIHRDLKPSNVIMEKGTTPRLVDFGLARQLESGDPRLSLPGDILGTPSFMAPEQADSTRGDVGPWTDVYGLGGILYALLVKRPPFAERDYRELRAALLSDTPPLSPRELRAEVPEEIATLCLRCLAKDPKARYRSAAEVANALRRLRAKMSSDACLEADRASEPTVQLVGGPGQRGPEEGQPARAAGLDLRDRLKPLDFTGFLSSKRKDFCGREWVFERIQSWCSEASDEHALLVTGDPGAGKSAVVAELVHHRLADQVVAHHCCRWDSETTLDPGRFVRSVAAMIASKLSTYARALAEPSVREALDEGRCRDSPGSAFEEGVLAPLERMRANEVGSRAIVVDALDEALSYRSRPTSIVKLLATRIDRFPPWLRLIATSRRDPEVLDRLGGLRAETIDAHDPRNLEDLDSFVSLRLETDALRQKLRASGLTREQAKDFLVKKSEGNFLYIQKTLEGIERDACRFEDFGELPPGLHGLYQRFFERLFPDDESFARSRRVLQALVAAQERLSEELLAAATELDPDEELPLELRRLTPYLSVRRTDGDARYAIFHKSLADWLTEPRLRGSRFFASPRVGHQRLAAACWNEYRRGARALSPYSLAYLPTHLARAERWQDLESLLCDLRFVEAKCAAGKVYELQRDYDAAIDSLAEPGAERERRNAQRQKLERYQDQLVAFARECTRRRCLAASQGAPETPQEPLTLPVALGAEEVRAAAAPARSDLALGTESSARETEFSRIGAFSTFVSRHSHLIAVRPEGLVLLARNHAGTGPIVEQAEALVAALRQVWIARDPRPPPSPALSPMLRTLRGHWDVVSAVAIVPAGTKAVSASRDRTVRVWDVASGEELFRLRRHETCVSSLATSSDGRLALAAAEYRVLIGWDLESGEERFVLHGHKGRVMGAGITPDGALAVSAGADRTLRVWDTASGREVRRLRAPRVSSLVVSADGARAVTANGNGTLSVWDLDRGQEIKTFGQHAHPIASVAVTPDGGLGVSGSRDLLLHVWDIIAGREIAALSGHEADIEAVALSADGTVAVSGGRDRSLRVWDLLSGKLLRTLWGHTGWVTGIAVSADGRTALTASRDRTLRVWDLGAPESPGTARPRSSWVTAVAVSSGGSTAVSGRADHTLQVWDLDSGDRGATLCGHTTRVEAVAVSPMGDLAVSAGADQTVRLWSSMSGRELRTFRGHRGAVTSATFHSRGDKVVSAGMDHTIRVWAIDSDEPLRILRVEAGKKVIMALAPDGSSAVSLGDGRMWCVWDIESGERAGAFSLAEGGDDVSGLVLCFDGRTAVCGSRDGVLRVVNVRSGEQIRSFRGHSDAVCCMALSEDGRMLASGGRDCAACVWDLAGGRLIATYVAGAPVLSISAIRADGRFACGTSDGQVHLLALRNLR